LARNNARIIALSNSLDEIITSCKGADKVQIQRHFAGRKITDLPSFVTLEWTSCYAVRKNNIFVHDCLPQFFTFSGDDIAYQGVMYWPREFGRNGLYLTDQV